MIEPAREIFIDIEPGLRIRYRRSEPPPPTYYAITLEVLEGAHWTAIRLWDNADHPDKHHEHAYTKAGKQPALILQRRSTNEAMALAIRTARQKAAEIMRRWESKS
jgi:hypothetical protein